ncbi:uncharacterized protein LOC100679786 [Nasonia vitripennis]|uniref:Mutator-like transposase domain-containing protein n=1 Tax=Nasonia vitripennis TaxID=7425 RepID=A0A7M7IVN5_NASVI|nr:uncharacterized protein LOC100679786 [Nasonia vitripennis]
MDQTSLVAYIQKIGENDPPPAVVNTVLEGRIFVCLERLAEGLVCKKCYAILSLLDAVDSDCEDLHTIYEVQCQNCQTTSIVDCEMNKVYAEEVDVRRNVLHDEHFGQRTGVKGRRILDVVYFANQLVCGQCNAILSLLDIIQEEAHGFASIFAISCRVCKTVCNVYTDKQHLVGNGPEKHFDMNTITVGSCILNGKTKADMDLFFSRAQIPIMDSEMFAAHEKEIRDIEMRLGYGNTQPE